MSRALVFAITLGTILVGRHAAACDMWSNNLDLRSTAIRAGLVVVAHRSDSTIALVSGDPPWEAFASFEVESVVKGSPLASRIAVATAWIHGGGIDVAPDESVVLFLERRGGRYYPVNDGCSVSTLPVRYGLEPGALARDFGFAWAEAPRHPWTPRVPRPIILGVACAGAGFALAHLMPRRR